MEQSSQGGGDSAAVVTRSPEKTPTASNEPITKRRSETFVMTGDKIIQKSSRVHAQRPISSIDDDSRQYSGSSVSDVKRRSYEHRHGSSKKRRSYAAGDSDHAQPTDNRLRSDNRVISGAISGQNHSAAITSSEPQQPANSVYRADTVHVACDVSVEANVQADVITTSDVPANYDVREKICNDIVQGTGTDDTVTAGAGDTNTAGTDDAVQGATRTDGTSFNNETSFDCVLPDPPDMLITSAGDVLPVPTADTSLQPADSVSMLRTTSKSVRSVSEVRQSEFYRSLDIPPDDISVEDERYKSVLIDLDSLPPPPDEFFDEPLLPTPSNQMHEHSPAQLDKAGLQHVSGEQVSNTPPADMEVTQSHIESPHPVHLCSETVEHTQVERYEDTYIENAADVGQTLHTAVIPASTPDPATTPDDPLAAVTDKQLHSPTTADNDKQSANRLTSEEEEQLSNKLEPCDASEDVKLGVSHHTPAAAHTPAHTPPLATSSLDINGSDSNASAAPPCVDELKLEVGKKLRKSSKKKKGSKLKKSVSAENVLLEVTVPPAVVLVDDTSPLIPFSSAVSLPDSSDRTDTALENPGASVSAVVANTESPKKRLVDATSDTGEAHNCSDQKSAMAAQQCAQGAEQERVRSKTVSTSNEHRPSSTSPASTSPDHSSQFSGKPPRPRHKDSVSTANQLVLGEYQAEQVGDKVTARLMPESQRRSSVGARQQQADKRRTEHFSVIGDSSDTPAQPEGDSRRSRVRSAISQPNLSPQKVPTASKQQTADVSPTKRNDRNDARLMAQKLFYLDGFTRTEVSAYLSKTDVFVQLVGEEFIKLYSFAGTTIEAALRHFLHTLPLIGETQERERVLSHFSRRYVDCNPNTFKCFDACHTITCAVLLLNTDLHGQNIGKKMTVDKFIKNLDGLNDGRNFDRQDLQRIYRSIRTEPLPLARGETAAPASTAPAKRPDQQFDISAVNANFNPMLDVPDPEKCVQYKHGHIRRKSCILPNGEPTGKGKRSWKLSYGRLYDLMLYLLKDETELTTAAASAANALRVHHALATPADDYAKKQSVFRLITADGAVCLIQAPNDRECHEWMEAINYAAATLSAPPLPSGVGSQRRFQRPLMPSSKTKHNLCEQLYHHEQRVKQTTTDLGLHRAQPPPANSAKVTVQEFKDKEQYLTLELQRFQTYCDVLRRQLSRTAARMSGTVPAGVNGDFKIDGGVTSGAVVSPTPAPPAVAVPPATSDSDRRPSQANVKDSAMQSLSDRSRALLSDDRTTAKLYERTVASFGTAV